MRQACWPSEAVRNRHASMSCGPNTETKAAITIATGQHRPVHLRHCGLDHAGAPEELAFLPEELSNCQALSHLAALATSSLLDIFAAFATTGGGGELDQLRSNPSCQHHARRHGPRGFLPSHHRPGICRLLESDRTCISYIVVFYIYVSYIV